MTSSMHSRRASRTVLAVVAALTAGVVPFGAGDPALAAPGVPAGSSAYNPVTPARLADTRPESGATGFTRLGPTTIRVQVTGRHGIAPGATSAVVNLASVNAAGAGFATAWPAGTPMPLASSLNVDQPGQVIANLATVRLSAGGAFDLHSNVAMDFVVDVAGTYNPVTAAVRAGRMATIAGGARRVLDTRNGDGWPVGVGGTTVVGVADAGVPADATAVVVNVAAVDANPGFWTSYPTGETLPLASSLNIDTVGQTRNSQGIVRLAPGTGSFNVFSSGGGHLVVDVVGWFSGDHAAVSTDGLFVAASSPTRVLDTRYTFPLAPWAETTVEFSTRTPGDFSAAAVAMNIAVVEPWNVGFITAYPAGGTRPFSANLNISKFDQIIANHAIVRNATRGIAVFTQNGAHIVVDVTGWYLGASDHSTHPAPPIPAFNPSYALAAHAPTAGLYVPVGYGHNMNRILDAGLAAVWGGSGILGQADHNVYFAHRTSKGGPLRNLNYLGIGDVFEMIGSDGVRYQYQVMRAEVIWPSPQALIDIVVSAGPITATLVACHPPHSTKYRLAVTGRLIGAVAG